MKNYFLIIFFSCSFFIEAAKKTNVIVIMADDIGAEGLGVYGSTIYSTPNLDTMANEGARYNNAYATPLCTPTRVMIMSGLYPNRTGYKALMGEKPGARLTPKIRTFGHDFRDAGYKTAIAGKWQLGKFDDFPGQTAEHGFDDYCMWSWKYEGQKRSRYHKAHYHHEGKIIQGEEGDYGPDIYSQFVLDFISKNKDNPFLVYYPMALPHTPFDAPPGLGELAKSKYPEGLDENTAKFGHLVTYMDDVVGRILKHLKSLDLHKNTLVIFTADNGTHRSVKSNLSDLVVPGGKSSLTEAGTRVPFIAWWPETIQPKVHEEFFSLADVLPTICSVAGIDVNRKLDGMDLSHQLKGGEGVDRDHVFMTWKGEYYVRKERFRLKASAVKGKDGGFEENFFDISIGSDAERYSEKISESPEFLEQRKELKVLLDSYMSIPDEYADYRGADIKELSPEELEIINKAKIAKKLKRQKRKEN